MSLLTPIALIAGFLAIPVILMYMLRLRRREVMVSSVFLWQQVLLDREANAPWQKLKRNLLLLLQLFILALLVFALARPFIIVPAVSAGQIALLLDASASMTATDSPDGTRFEEAKRRALEIVNTMGANNTMTVIRVADVPEVLAPYTGDRAALRNAVESARPSLASADWSAALTLAAAGAPGAEDFTMVLVSDGGLGDALSLPVIPGEVQIVPVGTSGSNVAITALATRSLPGQPPQLFAQITNFGEEDAEVVFDLRVDGQLFTARRYTVPAQGSVPLVSEALPEAFTALQAGLTIPAESEVPDFLAADNDAWAVHASQDSRRVLLMSSGNYFVEQVLRTLPGVQVVQGDPARGLPGTPFDLYIFDGWLPESLPAGDLLIINPPASTPLFTVGESSSETGSIRVQQDDRRVAFVDFDNVNIASYKRVSADWADALITAQDGPLLLAGEIGGRQVAVMPFSIFESDLPLQITWPVLMANLLDWYEPQDVLSVPEGLKIGDSVALRPPLTATRIHVTLPNGDLRELPAEGEQTIFAETDAPGIYTVEVLEGDDVVRRAAFTVNLFDQRESAIAPVTSIALGESDITAAEEDEIGQREFWPWLVLLALAVLLLEWLVYHRRLRLPAPRLARSGKTRPARAPSP